jgi:hypothetical protein
MIRWSEIIERVKEILSFFESQAVKPTLRAIFYRLVAENRLPNTISMYQSLSRALVKARKDGEIAFDALEDHGRYSIQNFGDEHLTEDELGTIEEICEEKIHKISVDTLLDAYFYGLSLEVPDNGYWARQPVIPEIWVEKDAIASRVDALTSDLSTCIRVNRGFGGWSFVYICTQDLKAVLDNGDHEKAVIFYIGDLDPSGLDMDRHLTEMLEFFKMRDRVEFRRLALLPVQVEQYNLPPKPKDAATLAKIKRDPRNKNYSQEYIVEVDALLGLAPEAFKTLVRTAISELHDESVYAEVIESNRQISQISRHIREAAMERAKAVLLS